MTFATERENPPSWWYWKPPLKWVYLALCAAFAAGIGVLHFSDLSLHPESEQWAVSFANGGMLLGLGALGTLLHWSKTNLSGKVLTLLGTCLILLPIIGGFSLLLLSFNLELPTALWRNAGLWLGLALVGFGFLSFGPAVRRFCATFLPLDPDDFAHTYTMAFGSMGAGLAVLSSIPFGQPLIYATLDQAPDMAQDLAQSSTALSISLASTALWSIPAAFLAVGFGLSRNLGESIRRLGLHNPTWTEWLAGGGTAILLVTGALVLDPLLNAVWSYMEWPTTDLERFAEIAGLPVHPLGMLLLGISAGVSEELLIRGVLQPRMGLLVSNIGFTLLHAFQYAADGLFVVFLWGCVFGLLRWRYGLVAAILAHALYDFILLWSSQAINGV